jgi:hypothetical protein
VTLVFYMFSALWDRPGSSCVYKVFENDVLRPSADRFESEAMKMAM